ATAARGDVPVHARGAPCRFDGARDPATARRVAVAAGAGGRGAPREGPGAPLVLCRHREPASRAIRLVGGPASVTDNDQVALLTGPNVVTLPGDRDGLIVAPEIDRYLVPSAWVERLFVELEPRLAGRLAVWPAGVDVDHWRPSRPGTRRAVVYRKDRPRARE